ncbi:unnamed protein product [Protopolystoma xenopodis]|uniref:C2 domain-containing protein n=1 Tax=Protopolystoma xenopodis TaxID=117903 RepID=A0A3S4ZYZ8_9PLAT|nr:unnamed protein product [Protopolystoma xenopodis]
MHSLNCNAVVGYTEECCLYEDVCILSSYGTAVHLNPNWAHSPRPCSVANLLERRAAASTTTSTDAGRLVEDIKNVVLPSDELGKL